jgi:FkbM family methyltransferase
MTLNKPEYFFRPLQVLQRVAFAIHPPGISEVRVSGGLRIRVNTREEGTYEIATSEEITRLLDGGEVAIDIGANIGWMTSVMARRVGSMGRVLSFEPNPIVLEILKRNLQMWRGDHSLAPITLHAVAVSSRRGSGRMIMPAGFGKNQGLATLEVTDGTSSEGETVTLDEIVGDCGLDEGRCGRA